MKQYIYWDNMYTDVRNYVAQCEACHFAKANRHPIKAKIQSRDDRLSWPSWLTCSGRLTHVSGHPLAAGRGQDRESPPAKDRRSTTEPTPPTVASINDVTQCHRIHLVNVVLSVY